MELYGNLKHSQKRRAYLFSCEGQIKAEGFVTLWVTTLNFDELHGLVSVFSLSTAPWTSDSSLHALVNELFLKPCPLYERDWPWPRDEPDNSQQIHRDTIKRAVKTLSHIVSSKDTKWLLLRQHQLQPWDIPEENISGFPWSSRKVFYKEMVQTASVWMFMGNTDDVKPDCLVRNWWLCVVFQLFT